MTNTSTKTIEPGDLIFWSIDKSFILVIEHLADDDVSLLVMGEFKVGSISGIIASINSIGGPHSMFQPASSCRGAE